MQSWLNYHHLFYFRAIAEEGSVSKAAARLRLGQPTLSAQLKQFEEALGVRLFERQHKRLVLTEQGKVALDYAREIFQKGSEMVEALHDRLLPARPSLAIGALDDVPKRAVLQLVRAALKVSPCQITLLEGRPGELLRELNSHRLDLLLTNFLPSPGEARGLHHRLAARNVVSVYGTAKFRELRRGFPYSLAGKPVILPTYDSRLRYDIDHWAKTKGLALDVVVESQDIAVKEMLAANGIGLLPAAAHAMAGGLVEIGRLDGVEEQLFLVSAERKIANPIAKKLMAGFTI